jgi:chromate reductase
MGAEVTLLDLVDLPEGAYSPDAYGETPATLESGFTDKVLEADGLVVVLPEYNGSYPGVLKLFVDMLPFPESFECRPVAFIGISAGASGAVRPVEQMQMVFAYRNAFLFNRRVFLPGISALIGPDDRITETSLVERLEEQASKFQAFVGQVKPLR